MEGTTRKSWVLLALAALLAFGLAGAAHAAEGWLGVVLQPLNEDLIEAMDLDRGQQGVLVGDIVEDSPAEEAGLEKGDVIIDIDGLEIIAVGDATKAIKSHSAGDKVKMVILRDGKRQVITAELGERDEEGVLNIRIPKRGRIITGLPEIDFPGQGYLGVSAQDISADLGQYFGVGCCEGVLVVDVVEDSPAEKAGIKAGDVILKVGGKDITGTEKLTKSVRRIEPGEQVELTLKRNRETRRITVKIGETPGAELLKKALRWKDVDDPEGARVFQYMGKPDIGEMESLRKEIEDLRDELEDLREEMEEMRQQ